jgi:glucan phosphoethanolaminetransferase (alkaline phosphatase superfamily)
MATGSGRLARFFDRLRSDLESRARPLRLLAILAALVLLPFLVSATSLPAFLKRMAGLFVILGLLVLAGIASRVLFLVLVLLLAVSAMLHQHVSRHWGGGQFDARAEAYFESSPDEVRQYLDVHVDKTDLAFLLAGAIFFVLLLRACWSMQKWPVASRLTAATLLAAGICGLAALVPTKQLRSFPTFEPIWRVAAAKQRYDQLALRAGNLGRQPLASQECRLRYDKLVVVIGESAISDRMSVFGYARPTTPFALSSNPYAFDALAPANQTRYSLAMMFTSAAPGSFAPFFTSHSLVGEVRACGFHTAWVSNQGRRGEWDSFATSLANEADEQIFLSTWDWSRKNVLDGSLVEEVVRRGFGNRERQATFLHLIGSHTKYGERYPAGFGFKGADTIGEQYDNSILYTDHVLSELYRLFAGGRLLFVYLSDHGQMVSETKFGSGYLPGYQEEYRTPLLVWTNDRPAIDAVRAELGGRRLNLESLDNLLRYLLGMSASPQISTSTRVSVLTPEIVRDYHDLDTLAAE